MSDTQEQPPTTDVPKRITDDNIRVRELSHYQFSWIAGPSGEEGTFTLQLVLDQGAWEEVLTVDSDDAEVLRGLLKTNNRVQFDVGRRVLMFGTTPVGA